MSESVEYASPSEAARRLGVSVKALRLYETRGLVTPLRLSNGWRAYHPDAIDQVARICALRNLGLSLTQVGRVLKGEPADLASALNAQEANLKAQIDATGAQLARVRQLREGLKPGATPSASELEGMVSGPLARFSLPWPWGGEDFTVPTLGPITFITGPLGCGKTRLATRLSEVLPWARFVGLDRAAPVSNAHLRPVLDWLVEDGATETEALVAVVDALNANDTDFLVIDMVEQGLDEATQAALMAHLRHRPVGSPRVLLMTRSNVILDIEAMGPSEAILFCPANHSPPIWVRPFAGSPGLEAVESCLASREVLARTEGTIAWRPEPQAAVTAT